MATHFAKADLSRLMQSCPAFLTRIVPSNYDLYFGQH